MAVTERAARLELGKRQLIRERVRASLHSHQAAFVADATRPRARVSACCTRRAGKSHGVAAALLLRCLTRPGLGLYIARTVGLAREILTPAIEEIASQAKLPLTWSQPDGRLMASLGSVRIWLAGCKDQYEIEKFRGPKYTAAAVDECQGIPALERLVDDILTPALLDLGGPLVLTGTPGPVPDGYYHRSTLGKAGWKAHRWSWRDNPHLPTDAADTVARIIEGLGGDDTGAAQREWWGRWVSDAGARIYPYDPSRNAATTAPDELLTVIGVDLGASLTTPTTALSVVAGTSTSPDQWVVQSAKRAGITPSRLVAWVEAERQRWRPMAIVVDCGGLGGGYLRELTDAGIPAVAAEKRERAAAIESQRGKMLAGTIKVLADGCQDLLEEWNDPRLAWTDKGYPETVPDHCSDATLYALRALPCSYQEQRDGPKYGSPEWEREEQARLRRTKLNPRKHHG